MVLIGPGLQFVKLQKKGGTQIKFYRIKIHSTDPVKRLFETEYNASYPQCTALFKGSSEGKQ
jgi:hypothetical protein